MRRLLLILTLMAALVITALSACTPRIYLWPTDASPQPSTSAGLANPASVFCQQNSGRSQIRRNQLGQDTGYCVFNDLSYCEEWSFYRSSCKPGDNKNFQ